MAFEKNTYEFKILLLVLVGIPAIASTNIDCSGKSFHCLNSTHFMICVDLGGGHSTTVDDFVIPCPPPTVCLGTNRFECEFPAPPAPTIQPIIETNNIEATTLPWEEIAVTSTSNQVVEQHMELGNVSAVEDITTDPSVIPLEIGITNDSSLPANETKNVVIVETTEALIYSTATIEQAVNSTERVTNVNVTDSVFTESITEGFSGTPSTQSETVLASGYDTNVTEIAMYDTNVTEITTYYSNVTKDVINSTTNVRPIIVETASITNVTEGNDLLATSEIPVDFAVSIEGSVILNATENVTNLTETNVTEQVTEIVIDTLATSIEPIKEVEPIVIITESYLTAQTTDNFIDTVTVTVKPPSNANKTDNVTNVDNNVAVNTNKTPLDSVVSVLEPIITNETEIINNASQNNENIQSSLFPDYTINPIDSTTLNETGNIFGITVGNIEVSTGPTLILNEPAIISATENTLKIVTENPFETVTVNETKNVSGILNIIQESTLPTLASFEPETITETENIPSVTTENYLTVTTNVPPTDLADMINHNETAKNNDVIDISVTDKINEVHVNINEEPPKLVPINVSEPITKTDEIITSTETAKDPSVVPNKNNNMFVIDRNNDTNISEPAKTISLIDIQINETISKDIQTANGSIFNSSSSVSSVDNTLSSILPEYGNNHVVSVGLNNENTESVTEVVTTESNYKAVAEINHKSTTTMPDTTVTRQDIHNNLTNIIQINNEETNASPEVIKNNDTTIPGNDVYGQSNDTILIVKESNLTTIISNTFGNEDTMLPNVDVTNVVTEVTIKSLESDANYDSTVLEQRDPTLISTTVKSDIPTTGFTILLDNMTTIKTYVDVKESDNFINTKSSNISKSESFLPNTASTIDNLSQSVNVTDKNSSTGITVNTTEETIINDTKIFMNTTSANISKSESFLPNTASKIDNLSQSVNVTDKNSSTGITVNTTEETINNDTTIPEVIQTMKLNNDIAHTPLPNLENITTKPLETQALTTEDPATGLEITTHMDIRTEFNITDLNAPKGSNTTDNQEAIIIIDILNNSLVQNNAINSTQKETYLVREPINVTEIDNFKRNLNASENHTMSSINATSQVFEETNHETADSNIIETETVPYYTMYTGIETTTSVHIPTNDITSELTLSITTADTNMELTTENTRFPSNNNDTSVYLEHKDNKMDTYESLTNNVPLLISNQTDKNVEPYLMNVTNSTDFIITAKLSNNSGSSLVETELQGINEKLNAQPLIDISLNQLFEVSENISSTLKQNSTTSTNVSNNHKELTQVFIEEETLTKLDNTNLPALLHMNESVTNNLVNQESTQGSVTPVAELVLIIANQSSNNYLNSMVQNSTLPQTISAAVNIAPIQNPLNKIDSAEQRKLNVSHTTNPLENLILNGTDNTITRIMSHNYSNVENNILNVTHNVKNDNDSNSDTQFITGIEDPNKIEREYVIQVSPQEITFTENNNNLAPEVFAEKISNITSNIFVTNAVELKQELIPNSINSTGSQDFDIRFQTDNLSGLLTTEPISSPEYNKNIVTEPFFTKMTTMTLEETISAIKESNVIDNVGSTLIDDKTNATLPLTIEEINEQSAINDVIETTTTTLNKTEDFAKGQDNKIIVIDTDNTKLKSTKEVPKSEIITNEGSGTNGIGITSTNSELTGMENLNILDKTIQLSSNGDGTFNNFASTTEQSTSSSLKLDTYETLTTVMPFAPISSDVTEINDPKQLNVFEPKTSNQMTTIISQDLPSNQNIKIATEPTILIPVTSEVNDVATTTSLDTTVTEISEDGNRTTSVDVTSVFIEGKISEDANVNSKYQKSPDTSPVFLSTKYLEQEMTTISPLPEENPIVITIPTTTEINTIQTDKNLDQPQLSNPLTNIRVYPSSTVSVTQRVSEVSTVQPSFDCQARPTGRYADNNDCRKFYICSGISQAVVGLCPPNTVFSEIRKQCTKNLSHCIRDNQFKCVSPGRYSDFLKQNVYYICVWKGQSFMKFKFQCQHGFYLEKTTVRCHRIIESQSVSQQSTSIDVSQSAPEKQPKEKRKDKKSKDKSKQDFECEEEGKFADPEDCQTYYICTKTNKSDEYRRKIKKCDKDEVFHKKKKKCVDADSYECS